MSQFPQLGEPFPLNADSTPTRDQISQLHVKFVRSGEKGSTKFFLNDVDLTQSVSAFAIDVSAKDRNARLILETPTGAPLHLEITDGVPADLILVPKDPKGFLPVQAVNNLIDVLLTHPDPEARQIAKDAAERINAQLRQDVPQPGNQALQAVDAPKINGVIPLHAPPAGSADDSWMPDADGPIGDVSLFPPEQDNGKQGQTSEQLIDEQLERESAAEGPGDAASES